MYVVLNFGDFEFVCFDFVGFGEDGGVIGGHSFEDDFDDAADTGVIVANQNYVPFCHLIGMVTNYQSEIINNNIITNDKS